MASYQDLEIMIEALTMTIAIHEREEDFFRYSAAASTSQEVKTLFLEIAEEMNSHLTKLEEKKQNLVKELASLKKRGERSIK